MCLGIIFFAHLLSLAKECIVHTTHLNKTSVQLAQITHDHRALKHIRKGEMHRHTASQCVSVRFSLASVASVPCNHVPPHNFIIINPELFHVTLLMSCPISHVICTFISFNANFCMYILDTVPNGFHIGNEVAFPYIMVINIIFMPQNMRNRFLHVLPLRSSNHQPSTLFRSFLTSLLWMNVVNCFHCLFIESSLDLSYNSRFSPINEISSTNTECW